MKCILSNTDYVNVQCTCTHLYFNYYFNIFTSNIVNKDVHVGGV